MTDEKTSGDKTLSLTGKTLSLKKPAGNEQSMVRQSFSHGRTKTVVVEKVSAKPRSFAPPRPGAAAPAAPAPAPAPAAPAAAKPAAPKPAAPAGMVLRTLSEEEREARDRVLAEARQRESEERKVSDEENRRRAEEEARRAAERAEQDRRQREEEDRRRAEEETRRRAEWESRRRFGDENRPRSLDDLGRQPRADQPEAAPQPEARSSAPPAREGRSFGDRPQGDRPGFGDRPPRPQGDRPYGDRPPRPQGDRPFGDRPPREGGFGARPQGDRPYGDRPPREDGFGDRPPRPQGDRPYGDRPPRPPGDRPFGDRPPREGGYAPRPAGDRPFGDRPPRLDGRPPRLDGPRPPRPFTGAPAASAIPTRPEGAGPMRSGPPAAGRPRGGADDDDGPRGARRGAGGKAATPAARPERPVADAPSRTRLTLTNALEDASDRMRSEASFRRRVQRMTGRRPTEQKEKILREVTIPETITIADLANRMSERAVDIIRMLMKQGAMHKITDVIDADTAQLIAEELGHTVKRVAESDVEEGLFDSPDPEDMLEPRAPVVTIMGHVDHGKTSLLDALRKTNVVSGEAGGITQHIGAYQVQTPLGGLVTFIDTPGHAAFTAMRARGAKVTDIVVLVVAANDSVMPQTVEAINHAKAAKVPLIVAINKIDLPDARPEKVKTDLLQYEVQLESLGGEVLEVELSAKTGQGLDKLLELIQLQAELLDLKANGFRLAEGTVIEAKLDRGRGPVATVLIQRGTMHPGDIIVAGAEWGRVRALINDKGETVDGAGPSVPVEVLGFNGTPEAGDRVAVVETEARAREIADYRQAVKREKAAARLGAGRSLVDMMSQLKAGAGKKEFPLIIKGDVQGSVEAIVGALAKVGNDEVAARVILSGVGGITESDVGLAQTAGAVVIGFNTRAHKEARAAAEQAGIEIRYYNIIYDLVDDMKAAMSGLLAPELRETMLGNAEILEVFNITKVGKVAGCRVTDGRVERGANVRLIRDSVVVHEGKLSTLKRFKDEVKEVQVGQECGMAFESYQDMRPGDVIECYRVEEIKRSL
ncbi:translation initiation factor IF-2 [Phreatobacter oligotrophus]|uniref:translation initiation factor IF-2 n=1 Tax=Phreatobacter oligotrophus TaxID=1122261 RepID=UPI00235217A7|nr:translation initiation factor IF-2 [Phreatobacter oligotrophus]MBX9992310.1 translation initiation factor IF-2 [Phreatobacter oligotrophus]